MNLDDALIENSQRRSEAMMDTQKMYTATEARIIQTFRARSLLAAAGFDVAEPRGCWDADELTLRVSADQLPLVRRTLDTPLVKTGTCLEDVKARTVCVRLTPTAFPSLTIEYVAKLPRAKKGKPAPKCRIVRVRQKASSYTTLVCER